MKIFYSLTVAFVFVLFYSCSTKQEKAIKFKPIKETEFNYRADSSFAIPHGKVWDERRKAHDSCMGSSYEANAIFIRTRDSFRIGSIVDMKTMKLVKDFDPRRFEQHVFSSIFSFTTKPCYEKRVMDIPVDSFMNSSFVLKIDSSNDKVNAELIDAIRNSVYTEVETGSWVNMEVTDALGKILDTTVNTELLEYKKLLLTPGNMILVRSSGITDISFFFHSKKSLSADLLKKLKEKPVVIGQPYFKLRMFYLDDTSFQLTMTGFFQFIGQFMKVQTE